MRLSLTGRHLDITPALRRLVTARLGKLERVLNDGAVSAQVVLAREKHRHLSEITLHARGEQFLHAVGDSGKWETSLTDATDKLAHQVQTLKGKRQERKRTGRQKMLLRPPLVIAFVRDRCDDAGLVIVPADGRDVSELDEFRVGAVGGDREARAQYAGIG